MLDEIDIEILSTVAQRSDSLKAEIIRFCSADRAKATIDRRINALTQAGLILQDKTRQKGRVFVIITPDGEKLLAGRTRCQPGGEQQ